MTTLQSKSSHQNTLKKLLIFLFLLIIFYIPSSYILNEKSLNTIFSQTAIIRGFTYNPDKIKIKTISSNKRDILLKTDSYSQDYYNSKTKLYQSLKVFSINESFDSIISDELNKDIMGFYSIPNKEIRGSARIFTMMIRANPGSKSFSRRSQGKGKGNIRRLRTNVLPFKTK